MKNFRQARYLKLSIWLGATVLGALLSMNVIAQTDAERIDQLEKAVSELTNGMAGRSSSSEGLPLHGFLDIGYASNNYEDAAVKLHGFNVGLLDFYLTPQFSDNVKSLVELVFEVDAHGKVVPDFERAQVGYTLNDNLTLWGGRFHTPYGYWNTAFHNGAQIQTSVLRPRFLAFGDRGGVLPAHMVGIWATGKTSSGTGKITYDAFAGNGPKLINVSSATPGTMDANMAGDNNHSPMIGLNIGYEFSRALEGLRLAAHSFQGSVDAYTNSDLLINSTEIRMLGGSAVFMLHEWELLSEYYHLKDTDRIGLNGAHSSWAGYVQVSKEIDELTPFIRIEKAALNQQDHYFSDQETGRAYARQSIGLSYLLNPKTSMKFELLNSKFEADAIRGPNNFGSVLVQYAIRF